MGIVDSLRNETLKILETMTGSPFECPSFGRNDCKSLELNMTQLLLPLYALTLLLSALLLFWVQLMVAKMLLPLLGGAPAVWNTCLFFFQALLLLGYGYSDWLTKRWTFRQQCSIQALVLLTGMLVLPITVGRGSLPSGADNPIPWLLWALSLSVGLPFFALSTLAPLLQAWFSQTSHPQAKDPYFLYGASNLGSLLGLLGYPLLFEPNFTLTQQNSLWVGGYALLIILTLCCGGGAWLSQRTVKITGDNPQADELQAIIPLTKLNLKQQLRWVVLAFIPSSWLLSITTYITTDIAAIPLFWAIPLSLYLVTFILAFARPQWRLPNWLTGVFPLLAVLLVMLLLLKVTQPLGLILPLHLVGFVIAASIFHQNLAQARPHPEHLTRFYLAIAFGGMLGGLLNSLIAPLVFATVLEYPLIIIVSLLLLRTLDLGSGLRLTWPLSIGLLIGCLCIGLNWHMGQQQSLGILVALGLFAGLAWGWELKRWQIGLGLGLVSLLGLFSLTSLGGVLTTQRSFFGVYQVLNESETGFHSLIHGTTVHGRQNLNPGQTQAPLTYFTPTGPIGQVFQELNPQFAQVAILGLGIGTLMSYAQPGQAWSFYEIDPLVVALAENPNYFTYLADAPAQPKMILGDGRLQLAQAPEQQFDLLVMDAFSSDAIPIHLITQEALQLYLSKLKPTGLIAINITNRFLDLEPVLAALTESLDLVALQQYNRNLSAQERQAGKTPSRWVIISRDVQNFGGLPQDPRWQPLTRQKHIPAWTDDFSQLWPLIQPLR